LLISRTPEGPFPTGKSLEGTRQPSWAHYDGLYAPGMASGAGYYDGEHCHWVSGSRKDLYPGPSQLLVRLINNDPVITTNAVTAQTIGELRQSTGLMVRVTPCTTETGFAETGEQSIHHMIRSGDK